MPYIHRVYPYSRSRPCSRSHIYPLVSPRLGFHTLNLAAPMAEYIYSSSYKNSPPGRPYTPPHSVYPAALISLSAREILQHLVAPVTALFPLA